MLPPCSCNCRCVGGHVPCMISGESDQWGISPAGSSAPRRCWSQNYRSHRTGRTLCRRARSRNAEQFRCFFMSAKDIERDTVTYRPKSPHASGDRAPQQIFVSPYDRSVFPREGLCHSTCENPVPVVINGSSTAVNHVGIFEYRRGHR